MKSASKGQTATHAAAATALVSDTVGPDLAAPTLAGELAARASVTAVGYAPQGHQLLSGGTDAVVTLWHLALKHRTALRLPGHKGAVTCVQHFPQAPPPEGAGGSGSGSPALFVTGSVDKTIRFWTSSVRGKSTSLQAHQGPVRGLAFFPDGLRLLSCGDDKAVKIWSVTTQRFVTSFLELNNWIRSIGVSSDGRLGSSAGDDKLVKLWDFSGRQTKSIHTFYEASDVVRDVKFGPDGFRLAACGQDRSIKIWDLRMLKLIQHYNAHDDTVTSMSWHPTGNWMITSSNDSTVKVWDLRAGFLFYTLSAHQGQVLQATFTPDGHSFASCGVDSKIYLWNSGFDQHPESYLSTLQLPPSSTAASATTTNTTAGLGIPQATAEQERRNSKASLREGRVSPTTTASRRLLDSRDGRVGIPGDGPSLPPPEEALPPTEVSDFPAIPASGSFPESHASHHLMDTAVTVGTTAAAPADTSVVLEYIVRQLDVLTRTVELLERRTTHVEAAQQRGAQAAGSVEAQLQSLHSTLATTTAQWTSQLQQLSTQVRELQGEVRPSRGPARRRVSLGESEKENVERRDSTCESEHVGSMATPGGSFCKQPCWDTANAAAIQAATTTTAASVVKSLTVASTTAAAAPTSSGQSQHPTATCLSSGSSISNSSSSGGGSEALRQFLQQQTTQWFQQLSSSPTLRAPNAGEEGAALAADKTTLSSASPTLPGMGTL